MISVCRGLFFCLMILVVSECVAQKSSARYVVSGVVTDRGTKEKMMGVLLNIKGTNHGTTSDSDGRFTLNVGSLKQGDSLVVRFVGYHTQVLPLSPAGKNQFKIALAEQSVTLGMVEVRGRRGRYVKKGNPATELARKLVAKRDANNPAGHEFLNYERYEKIIISLNEPPDIDSLRRLSFINDYVDTSDISHRRTLPVSVKERIIDTHIRERPYNKQERVRALRNEGIDDKFSEENISNYLHTILDEINIYTNDIYFVQRYFVSPLSDIAVDFYKYYLSDTMEIDGRRCVELSFYPYNKESLGFSGKMVVGADSVNDVHAVTLNFPRGMNLNFVEDLVVTQKFERDTAGRKIIVLDDMNFEVRIASAQKGMTLRRVNSYRDYDFRSPDDPTMFAVASATSECSDAREVDPQRWFAMRHMPISKQEQDVARMTEQLRSLPLVRLGESLLVILEQGYIGTGKRSLFDIGPVLSILASNDLEGTRLRFGGLTTANLNPHLFFEGYVAYGFKDRRLKYNAMLEYSFIKKKMHPREFPIHALRVQYGYDANKYGQKFGDGVTDNVLTMFRRRSDSSLIYVRNAEITYQRETNDHLAYDIGLRRYTQWETPLMRFSSPGYPMSQFTMSEMYFHLRYAPNEKIYQTKLRRRNLERYTPVFELTHNIGIRNFMGSDFRRNFTQFRLTKRFNLSPMGYLDMDLQMGAEWNAVPYMLLPHAKTNPTYIIRDNAFALMNPMEFMYDRYVDLKLVYYLNGFLLNKIPLIKHLKWREVITLKGVFGKLTDKNNPAINRSLPPFPHFSGAIGAQPYVEVSLGIENIFRLFRIEYVQRLTYLDRANISAQAILVTANLKF